MAALIEKATMDFLHPLPGYFKTRPTTVNSSSLIRGLLTCFLGLSMWGVPSIALAEPIAIIVNIKNHISSLRAATIASMYRGEELHWPHGKRIKLVNREISSFVRNRFYREILNAKPDRKFYRPGTPIAVHSLIQRSDEAVIRFVASIEDAIRYVELSKVTDRVKVIFVLPSGED